jgi:hypothetical protein
MTSTRNLNTPQDYKLEKKMNQQFLDYNLYTGSKVNDHTSLLRNAANPMLYGGQLSRNSIDVESMLRGIQSANLEGVSFTAKPDPVKLPEISYFTRTPIIIPPSFQHYTKERPNYLA